MVASAIRSLRKNTKISFDIHAFNATFNPVTAYLADRFSILPSGHHPDFLPQLLSIVKKNDIHVLLPWSDEEAIAVSSVKDELKAVGCIALSPPDVITTITDKAETYEILKKSGLRVPKYTIATSVDDINPAMKNYGYPRRTVIVKPATGRGGRGVTAFLGEDSPAEWLGRGRREKRITDFDLRHIDIIEGERYLVMPCLSAPVYDADVFRQEPGDTVTFVRERINPTGILSAEMF